METIKWIAGNGKEVEISHKTERENIGDHTLIEKCDEIALRYDGQSYPFGGLINDNTMIQTAGIKIRIPAEHQDAIADCYKGIADRRAERNAKLAKSETEYKNHYNNVSKMMEACK